MTIHVTQEGEIFTATGTDKEFSCGKCGTHLFKGDNGFICKVDKNIDVYCEACQDSWNKGKMSDNKLCQLDIIRNKRHDHIKVIRK